MKEHKGEKQKTPAEEQTQRASAGGEEAEVKAAQAETDAAPAESEANGQDVPAEPTAEERISALEKENAELKDQYLRKVADFDNYRKRMIREKQDAFDYANTNLLSDLLESLDNFDRALESARNATDVQSVVEGVQMTKDRLVSMLETKYNLSGYGAKGDSFDPNVHEAIGSSNGPVAEPICSEIYLKGYKLKDRVIRHAKVMVQMPDGSVAAEENADSSKI
ncbi:nucleotide exchange factor GrpE [Treponema brennaborense]|uniref:Protein GrpE n=1 Tax=Treponema brennaborense (strain DSM 12168 / CIP 105900 / DD5/3) TaxID=906968 RepID=F4LNT7_TREBD|nr:nucleotide exchange factor GrpE [Treponema brennaborense]AEE16922.1 Protein grpE [Treponema brennaborense DSM 12168]